ncbi:MAG: peptidoglycan DD-metalloendopeptidase family protein, partial [Acidobacteriota bacterium]
MLANRPIVLGVISGLLVASTGLLPAGTPEDRSHFGPILVSSPVLHAPVLEDGALAAASEAAADSLVETPEVIFSEPLVDGDVVILDDYVDLDPSPGLLDWSCRQETYDGHNGTDYSISSFLEMDRGRFVLAAAPGTVTFTDDGHFDRNTRGQNGLSNSVSIRHDDGTISTYLHLAKWSVIVSPGERVEAGQPLGLTGSSGRSYGPHVHFELRRAGGVLDPYAGPCRSGESLWSEQAQHIAFEPARLLDAGVTNSYPDWADALERPPGIRHVRRSADLSIVFWITLEHIKAGDVSEVRLIRPDGFEQFVSPYTHQARYPFSLWYWGTWLSPEYSPAGEWTFEYRLNGELQARETFEFSDRETARPTVVPAQIEVRRGVARGMLEATSPDAGVERFEIVTAPEHGKAQLHGPRQQFFSYLPDSGFEGIESFTVIARD